MARIDRLPEASKTALQVASVIGREFSARLVERVAAIGAAAQQALGELRAVELIYQSRLARARLHVQARPHSRRGV